MEKDIEGSFGSYN